MGDFFNPEVVYLFFIIGGMLALIEAAVTTFGAAGASAGVFAFLMMLGIASEDLTWWPLVPAAIGTLSLCVPLALHKRVRNMELAAVGLLGSGSLLYALLNKSIGASILAVVVTVSFYFGTDRLFKFVEDAANAPNVIGMDTLIGKMAEVVRWEGTRGTIMLDGAYWSVDGPPGVRAGHHVTVLSHDGMRLKTALAENAPMPAPPEPKVEWGKPPAQWG